MIVSYTLLDIITAVLVIVMLQAYLRLTEKNFTTEKRHMIRNLVVLQVPLLRKITSLGRQWNRRCPDSFSQQLWLLWQHVHLPNFCGKCSFTVSLQYKTKTWLAKSVKLHSVHPFLFPVLYHEKRYYITRDPPMRRTSSCQQKCWRDCETLGSCAHRILVLL